MKTKIRVRRDSSKKAALPQSPNKPEATAPEITGTAPAEFKVMRLRECPVDSAVMDNPEAVVKFWLAHVESAPWFKSDKECLVVMLLDTRLRVMGFEMLSQGTKDTLLVNVPEVFRTAAMKSAAKIIVAHNHPSGEPSPSEADIKITRDLIRAGELIKIPIADHVIIGGETETGGTRYASHRELGYFYGSSTGTTAYPSAATIVAPEASAPLEAAITPKSLPPLKRVSVIQDDNLCMEVAMNRAVGLLDLLTQFDCAQTERGVGVKSSIACGFQLWGWDLCQAIQVDYTAAYDANRNGGDKTTAGRRLGKTVQKVIAMLRMVAHDLHDGGDYPDWEYAREHGRLSEFELSPHLALAEDCIEYLEASFYQDFARHLPQDGYAKEYYESLVRKFVKSEEQRAAA